MAAASGAATAVCRGNIGLNGTSCLSSIRFVKGKEAVAGRFVPSTPIAKAKVSLSYQKN